MKVKLIRSLFSFSLFFGAFAVLLLPNAGRRPSRLAWPAPIGTSKAAWPARSDDLEQPRLLARMGSTKLRHAGRIMCLAFSPDGKTVATGGHTGLIRLWSVKTGALVREINTGAFGIGNLVVTPDGKHLLASGMDQADDKYLAKVWRFELARRKTIAQFHVPSVSTFSRISISRDGRRALAIEGTERMEQGFTCSVWDTFAGKKLTSREVSELDITGAALSPDGKSICMKKRGGTLILVDAKSGRERARMTQHKTRYTVVAFSQDNRTLFSAGGEVVHAWDAATGRELSSFKTPGALPQALVVRSEGKRLILNEGKTVSVWDAPAGNCLHRFEVSEKANLLSMGVSEDGAALAGCGGGKSTVRLWNIHAGREITPGAFRGHDHDVATLVFTVDGRQLATLDNAGFGHIWDASNGRHLRRLSKMADSPIPDAHFLSPGRKIIAGDRGDQTIHEWEIDTGKTIRKWQVDASLTSVAVSPDEKTLATTHSPGRVHLWNVETGKRIGSLPALNAALGQVQFSADGRLLAAAVTHRLGAGKKQRTEGFVRIWDLKLKKEAALLRGFRGYFSCMVLSRDGRTIIGTGTKDKFVRVIEIATGKERDQLAVASDHLSGADLARDGRRVAVSSFHQLELWDMAVGRRLWTTPWLAWRFSEPVFSPDGKRLAIGWGNGLCEVWRLPPLASPKSPNDNELSELWRDLGGSDAKRAWRAVWRLALGPKVSLPLLRKNLQPVVLTNKNKNQISLWIDDLNDDNFRKRTKATANLRSAGDLARPLLFKAMKKPATLELHQRLTQLLQRLDESPPTGETLRAIRAIETLEYINSPEAKRIVERIAGGTREMRITEEARRTLSRWVNSP